MHAGVTREDYFRAVLADLYKISADGFTSLKTACATVLSEIKLKYPLPTPSADEHTLQLLPKDSISLQLMPRDAKSLVPLVCSGDGNCLFRLALNQFSIILSCTEVFAETLYKACTHSVAPFKSTTLFVLIAC